MSSLTELQARTAIANRWKTYWSVLYPSINFKLENEQFVEPTDLNQPWVEVEIRSVDSIQETMGPVGQRQYLRFASIWVRLHVPRNIGTEYLSELIDAVRGIYEGVRFDSISPSSSSAARTLSVGSDGKWFETVVIFPIQYTEQR